MYKDNLCRWPSYAAHVIFEVWRPNNNVDTSGSNSANKAAGTSDIRYVRVLYDGVDITQSIPTCREEREALLSQKKENSGNLQLTIDDRLIQYNSPLCSLGALQKQISNLIAPHTSIEEACVVK